MELGNPGFLFFPCERFRFFREQILPDAVGQDVFVIIGDVDVDSVVAVRAADIVAERQIQDFRILAEHQISALLPARRVQWTRDC